MQYLFGVNTLFIRVMSAVIATSLVIAGFVTYNAMPSSAVGSLCVDGTGLLVNGSTSLNTAVTSNQPVQLKLNSTNPQAELVTDVIFYLNGSTPLGRGVREGSYSWQMMWVPGLANLTSGQAVQLTAKVFYNDTAAGGVTSCVTQYPINTQINTYVPAQLNATISPTQWSGPMGTPININTLVSVSEPAFNPSQFAIFEWSNTIGFLTPNNQNAQLSSGSTVGTGMVKVKIQYSGATKYLTIPIEVKSPDAPLPPPTSNTTTNTTNTTNTSPTTAKTNTTNNTSTTVIAPPTTIQTPTVQDCVASAIGLERFTAINTATVRPTPEEIEKIKICFASSNYVVPSNFAPVAPTGIKKLPIVKTVKINSLENEKRITDNVEKNVLRFIGTAKPNSIVFIYVFSDPLVLTTTTDGEGNWEYVLEDPIEPGNHEVYSVVNRGDGVYERSDALSFTLSETAEAATVNPNGLTLKLANATPAESQRSMGLYIIGSVTVLSLAVAGFLLTLIKRNRTASSRSTFSAFPADQTLQTAPEYNSESTVTYSPITEDQSSQTLNNSNEIVTVGDNADDTSPKV